jgi:spermidine synthase
LDFPDSAAVRRLLLRPKMNLPTQNQIPPRPILRLLPVLFFFSGVSSLVFETTFARLLTYTFGNTAHSVSTVLAAFLGGLALGAFIFGRWVDRRGASLLTYGILELLVATYCLFTPQLFSLITTAYLNLCHLLRLGPWSLTVVRFGLAGMVILIPTILMGGTLPVLARCVAASLEDFQPAVDRLYAWNTFGAATGTLASTYLLLPSYGVKGTVEIACVIDFAIFLAAAAWSREKSLFATAPSDAPVYAGSSGGFAWFRGRRGWLLAGAFFTGVVALAYEVVWTHALGFLIGNTVYAFGVMLFTFLCGLGLGAQIVARRLTRPGVWPRALAASQLFLGITIFATLPLWNHIPDVFARGLRQALVFDLVCVTFLVTLRMAVVAWKLYRRPSGSTFSWWRVAELGVGAGLMLLLASVKIDRLWQYEATPFVTAELLRFFCAFLLLILPCLLLGLSFPLLLNLATQEGGVGTSVGGIYAANTLGTVLGSVVTGFLVLPALGSLAVLRAAATVNLVLGLAFALLLVPLTRGRKWTLTLVVASLGLLFWKGSVHWDARNMTRGTYVYFNKGWPLDRVLYFQEDVQGGLTSVIQRGDTRTLLSNGKFQGNNTGEVSEQTRSAMTPLLFTPRFNRALVIGLGTGNTLRVVARFPFQKIDAVEIAPHIVDAARLWFKDVNSDVFDRDPRVKLSIADGRNFLLLSQNRYDMITIEISSIWISGEADLYNREFYELCRSRLTRRGVLQQWVQIHHMRTVDLLVILNTAAQVFPHVAFFLGPEQGLLIASAAPFECDVAQIDELDRDPGVRHELAVAEIPSLWSLLGEIMLFEDSFRQAVAYIPRLSDLPAGFSSTDNRPYLEYQTPKGNTLQMDTGLINRRFLQHFRPQPLPAGLLLRGISNEDGRNLLLGYVLIGRDDPEGALQAFRRVRGPAAERAAEAIAYIESHPSLSTR